MLTAEVELDLLKRVETCPCLYFVYGYIYIHCTCNKHYSPDLGGHGNQARKFRGDLGPDVINEGCLCPTIQPLGWRVLFTPTPSSY